jgi:prevent-host-death family protein
MSEVGNVPRVVNVHEAKTQLSKLLEAVRRGEEIILAKGGKPYAKLVPVAEENRRPLGFVSLAIPDAFFDPLPEEELRRWE